MPYNHKRQTAKARPPPTLRLQMSVPRPAADSVSPSDQDMLHDLPSPSSISSSPYNSHSFSPISPTSPTFQNRSTETGRSRRTPPPPRARSVTPQPFNAEEAEQFASYCRAWFFSQDEAAGQLMSQTLTKIHASQRAQLTRIQASIRSAYHSSVAARREAEFQAHIRATQPGGSLMPHSRADPSGPTARRERFERFQKFIQTWCHTGMAGTRPFFESLWAVMRLQVIPESLGGAGHLLIDWELDDAVFMESAGKDFMLEAIDILKGVLGFQETTSIRRTTSFNISKDNGFSRTSRTQSQIADINMSNIMKSHKPSPILSTTHKKRHRATSNPFLEADSGPSSELISPASDLEVHHQKSVEEVSDQEIDAIIRHAKLGNTGDMEDRSSNLRIWTLPDLTNTEYLTLITLFPAFLSQRTLPRFSTIPPTHLRADIEEALGDDQDSRRNELRFGSGTFWLGVCERTGGWQGSWWQRLLAWWRQIFC